MEDLINRGFSAEEIIAYEILTNASRSIQEIDSLIALVGPGKNNGELLKMITKGSKQVSSRNQYLLFLDGKKLAIKRRVVQQIDELIAEAANKTQEDILIALDIWLRTDTYLSVYGNTKVSNSDPIKIWKPGITLPRISSLDDNQVTHLNAPKIPFIKIAIYRPFQNLFYLLLRRFRGGGMKSDLP